MSIGGGGRRRPGQLDHPVEPGADHAVLGRRVGHPPQARQLLGRLGLGLLGHAGLVDGGGQLGRSPRRRPPPSPSSFWIAAICSRSMPWRWRSVSAALVWRPISAERRSTFRRWARIADHLVQARLQIEGLEDLLLLAPARCRCRRRRCRPAPRGWRSRRWSARSSGRGLGNEVEDLQRLLAQVEEPRLDLVARRRPVRPGAGRWRPGTASRRRSR